jgi:hypothetical protein
MLLLRMAFLAPAIADFVIAILTLYRMDGVVDESLVPRGGFAGAAFCWTILLLLGMRKPVERAWILLPTALLIGCVAAAYLWGYVAGTVSVARMALVLGLNGTMIWLCWTGLRHARSHRYSPEPEA